MGAQAQLIQVEHEVDRHAVRLQMLEHAVCAGAAGGQEGAQVVGRLQHGLRFTRLGMLAEIFGHAGQLA